MLCEFSVGSPPEVVEGLVDLTIIAPDKALLECKINPGDPKASLNWFKDAKEIYG